MFYILLTSSSINSSHSTYVRARGPRNYRFSSFFNLTLILLNFLYIAFILFGSISSSLIISIPYYSKSGISYSTDMFSFLQNSCINSFIIF